MRPRLDPKLIVAEAVELPSPEVRELSPLPPSEAGRLITLFEKTDLFDVVVFAIGSGLRLGEILGVRWLDVDLSTGRMGVVQTLHVDGTFDTPKTHASRAIDFLPVFAIEALRRQRADRTGEGCYSRETGKTLTLCSIAGMALPSIPDPFPGDSPPWREGAGWTSLSMDSDMHTLP